MNDDHDRAAGLTTRQPKALVGGPIQYGMRDGRFDESLKSELLAVIDCLRQAGWQVLSSHLAEDFGTSAATFTPDVVTKRDYGWMLESDVYIAVLPTDASGAPIFSGGTCVELGWASARSVPIIVLWDEGNSENYSHLIRGLHTTATVRYLDLRDCLGDGAPLLAQARSVTVGEQS